jgi:hypothetical protein
MATHERLRDQTFFDEESKMNTIDHHLLVTPVP